MYIVGMKRIRRSQWDISGKNLTGEYGRKKGPVFIKGTIRDNDNGSNNHDYRFVRANESGLDNILQDITGTFGGGVFR